MSIEDSQNTIIRHMAPDMAVVALYNFIQIVALVENVIHVATILKIPHPPRHGGKIYKDLILGVAACDLTFTTIRLLTGNATSQRFMAQHQLACALSSFVVITLLTVESACILVMSIDRFLAIQYLKKYWDTIFVRHFRRLVVPPFLIVISANAVLPFVFIDVYAVKDLGVGSCAPGLEIGRKIHIASLVMTALLLGTASLMCVAHAIRVNDHTEDGSMKMTLAASQLYRIVISIVVIGYLSWSPILATLIARFLKIECKTCRWFGIFFPCLPAVLNPIAYYLQRLRYRRELRKWFCPLSQQRIDSDQTTTNTTSRNEHSNVRGLSLTDGVI